MDGAKLAMTDGAEMEITLAKVLSEQSIMVLKFFFVVVTEPQVQPEKSF